MFKLCKCNFFFPCVNVILIALPSLVEFCYNWAPFISLTILQGLKNISMCHLIMSKEGNWIFPINILSFTYTNNYVRRIFLCSLTIWNKQEPLQPIYTHILIFYIYYQVCWECVLSFHDLYNHSSIFNLVMNLFQKKKKMNA